MANGEPLALALLSLTTVGALVAWSRPRNPIGWLLFVDGLVWLSGGLAVSMVGAGSPDGDIVLAVAWVDTAGWVIGLGLVPVALWLFPSGRPPLGRAGTIGWCFVGTGVAFALVNLLTPGQLPSWPEVANPFGIQLLAGWGAAVGRVLEPVFLAGCFIGPVAAMVPRFRRSRGIEQQQFRWVIGAAGLLATGALVSVLAGLLGVSFTWVFTMGPLLVVPVALAVAVLRHRLWEVDSPLGRVLVYGVVALAISLIYVGVVAGLGAVIGAGRRGDVGLAIVATAMSAALLNPLVDLARSQVRRRILGPGAGTQERDPGPPPDVLVQTLGGLEVHRHGEPVGRSEWQSRKARQLLGLLVCRRGRPVHRDELIGALWPDEAGPHLANRLAVAASTLRSVMDPDHQHGRDHFVSSGDRTLRLDLDHVAVDIEQFLVAARSGLATDGRDLTLADDLYRGDFLVDDLYDDWSQPLRERARATHLAVLRGLADQARHDDVDTTIEAHLRILEVDPWDESSHVAVVTTLAEAGRRGEARRARRRYHARMLEIGVEPRQL